MHSLLNQVSSIAAGFSVIALLLLFFQKRIETRLIKYIGHALLITLLAIQCMQGLYMAGSIKFYNNLAFIYILLLGLAGPLFYLYCQHVINPDTVWQRREYLYLIPAIVLAILGWFSPPTFRIAYAMTFLFGGIYMARLGWLLLQFRSRRTLFNLEFILVGAFLGWALLVTLVGVLSIQDVEQLIPVQIIMLALAVAAALHIQLNYPHLLSTLEELAQKQYQTTTLASVDCDEVESSIETLMSDKKIYQDGDLTLSTLAERLDLKSYQLSEYINTRLGMSFSSWLRQQRVRAAEQMLKDEPEVSVLAVGLAVGFSSQSAFYTAFREVHGIAPGQYRKQHLAE